MQVNLKDGMPPLDQLTQSIRESQLVAITIPPEMLKTVLDAVPKLAAFTQLLPFSWAKGIGYWLALIADFVDDLGPGTGDISIMLRLPTIGTTPDKDHLPETVDLISLTITATNPK